jgi:hypothetical protein
LALAGGGGDEVVSTWHHPSVPWRRGIVAVTVATAVTATAAAGAPPRAATITVVGQTSRHATATWTLPPGVVSDMIEIATSSAAGSEGGFFTENVTLFDLLQQTQTSYVSTDRLDVGTYWVHVKTLDNDCSYAENNSCFAWSAPAQLVIPQPPNRRPTLRFLGWEPFSGDARTKVCDDTASGRLTFRTTLKRDLFGRGTTTRMRVYRASSTPTFEDGDMDCATYYVPLPNLLGVARYTMTMTVSDGRGAISKPLVRRWVVND